MRLILGLLFLSSAGLGLAGCLSVEHLPPEDEGVDPALLAAAQPGSAGPLTWMSREWDSGFEALVLANLGRTGLFSDVRVVVAESSKTWPSPGPLPAPGGWVLSRVRSFDEGKGASFREEFPITLLTLGIWPTTSSRHTTHLYCLRRMNESESDGATIRITDGYGAVAGLVALPMSLDPDWEFRPEKETRRRRMADHLANEVIRTVLRKTGPQVRLHLQPMSGGW